MCGFAQLTSFDCNFVMFAFCKVFYFTNVHLLCGSVGLFC